MFLSPKNKSFGSLHSRINNRCLFKLREFIFDFFKSSCDDRVVSATKNNSIYVSVFIWYMMERTTNKILLLRCIIGFYCLNESWYRYIYDSYFVSCNLMYIVRIDSWFFGSICWYYKDIFKITISHCLARWIGDTENSLILWKSIL